MVAELVDLRVDVEAHLLQGFQARQEGLTVDHQGRGSSRLLTSNVCPASRKAPTPPVLRSRNDHCRTAVRIVFIPNVARLVLLARVSFMTTTEAVT
ncbi:MAG: hypothetical protein JWR01_2889 [Subtercola sp.]|nr:hypothetical protein [Subtercola sp.]